MQLISIAHRIKTLPTSAGLKRRRNLHNTILFPDDATLLRVTSSLHHKHQISVSNNDARRYSQIYNGQSMLLDSNKYYFRRGNAFSLFPDHYRSYGTQTSQYQSSQMPSPFQHLSAVNDDTLGAQHRSRKPSPRASTHISHDTTTQTLHAISKRLSFFFSDANLRHDVYARSILEKYEHRYLPLDDIMSFKSIQKWTDDPNVVLNAVDHMNDNVHDYDSFKLIKHTSDTGNVFIGREEPFHYDASMKEAQHRIMLLEGWPSDRDTRRIEDRLKVLLCTKNTDIDGRNSNNNRGKNLIAYWNTDIGKGLKTIEFQTEEGAADAWSNLARAAKKNIPNARNPNQLMITITEDADDYKEYQLKVQNLSLVARSMTFDSLEIKDQITPVLEQQQSKSEDAVQMQNESTQTVSLIEDETSVKTKWWADGSATPPLHMCVEAMDDIFQKHSNLPPPSRGWLHEYIRGRKRQHDSMGTGTHQSHHEQCMELCNDAANLISCVEHSIAEGKIRGLGGKDAYLLSELLGRAMLIFSETPPPRGTHSRGRVQQLSSTNSDNTTPVSPYEACLGVMDMLKRLNLDILSSHYACTIRAACHEARWEEASYVFLNQISGNDGGDMGDDIITGGFSPINPTLGWDQPLEVGLYAVARNAWYQSLMAEQQQQSGNIDSPSKQVFDAAMNMCMISPSEQDRYVLAAGSALGRAGLWSECLDLATEPASISTYGPSITAAAMLACIESARYNEAIDAFDYFMSGSQSVASEWQWSGGNITAVEPICRDLALTAMGNVSRGGYSKDARHMFDVIMEEGIPLSCDGLIGLMRSLENDGKWKEAVELLDRFVASNFNVAEGKKWRIVPNVVQLQKDGINDDLLASEAEVSHVLEEMLASAMRVCNSEGQFGLAAVLCTIVNKTCFSSSGYVDATNNDGDAILGAIAAMLQKNTIFKAYTHSLYGLGCKRIAERLINNREDVDTERIVQIPKRLRQNLPMAESWIGAVRSIDYLLEAKSVIQLEPGDLCPESSFLFERGLVRAMEYCNDSNQPTAALYLFHHAARTLLPNEDQHLTDRFKSFFGMGKQADQNPREEIFTSDDSLDFSGIELSDSMMATIIGAYIKMGRPDQALSTYSNAISQVESPRLMRQSSSNILEVLLEIDSGKYVNSLDDRISIPATFITVAKHLADNGVWHEIGEVYNQARRAGCISEELGFIAMQAVNESELVEGKIVVCRNIAKDVSNTIGVSQDEWIKSRYWNIKRYVGYHYARLLMNWNDHSTSKKSELIFAINEMRSCSNQGALTKNAPLMFIAQQGDLYSTGLSDRERRSIVNLILEACVEANRSNLLQKHTFTAQVALSLRTLNANTECIKIVRGLVARVGRCHHQVAMEEAIYAATEERDYDSLEVITNKYEESGYDSTRLHL